MQKHRPVALILPLLFALSLLFMTPYQLVFVVSLLLLANALSYRYRRHPGSMANALVVVTLVTDLFILATCLVRVYTWLGSFSA